jgi:hypothetical protein
MLDTAMLARPAPRARRVYLRGGVIDTKRRASNVWAFIRAALKVL